MSIRHLLSSRLFMGRFGILVAMSFVACGGKSPDQTCEAGFVKLDGRCAMICRTTNDCPAGESCSSGGVCVPGVAGSPIITNVQGNDSTNENRIRDGLIITGSMLDAATFELRRVETVFPLDARARTATSAEVVLPPDIRSGAYTLVAMNAVGTSQAPVTLTLPELTGDILLDRINADATGTVSFARLPVGTSGTTVAAGNHSHSDPILPVSSARATCKAIFDAGDSVGDGVYWIDPNGGASTDAFHVYCDMTTEGGGWTLVMGIVPTDGSVVSFTNTVFWRDEAEYGQFENRFTHDFKSPAAWLVSGTAILVQVANPGPTGRVLGYRAWNMANRSLDTFFDAAANTTQTTSEIGANVSGVYAYEPIIKQANRQLQSNRQINTNNDRVRLGIDGYPAQGDDNSPGLGTQMNEATCGIGVNCNRYRDVELWVNSTANLWCSAPTPGTYKWIGTDGGCGSSCVASDCDSASGPGYSPWWTYRIFIR